MDDFSKVLQSNGINPITGFFQKKRWKKIEKLYNSFLKEYSNFEKEWESCREQLKNDWGRTFPDLNEICHVRELRFSSPDEAMKAIQMAQRKLNSFSCQKEYKIQDSLARLAWLNFEVSQEGRKSFCDLIVLREENYEPSRAQLAKFCDELKKGNPCTIRLADGSAYWAAIKPGTIIHKSEAAKLLMTAQGCKVDYLCI